MKKNLVLLISALFLSFSVSSIPTPDLTSEQKEQVINYTNENLDQVPDHIRSAVTDEKINVEIRGEKTYGLKFEDGELTNVYNEGFSEPTIVFSMTEEAADKLVDSSTPYQDAVKMAAGGDISIDRDPDVGEELENIEGVEGSSESSTGSSSSGSGGGVGGVVDSAVSTVTDAVSSAYSTVTNLI